MSYAATVASGILLAGPHSTQGLKAPFAQTQREVIWKIRDPPTVQILRAVNLHNVKVYVGRAIK